MNEVLNISISDFFKRFSPEEIFGSKLAVIEMKGTDFPVSEISQVPARINAISILVVNKGEMVIDIDYLTYKVKKHMSIMLVEHCIIENVRASHDFRGYHVIISRDLARETMSRIEEIPKGQKGPQHLNLISQLEENDARILTEQIQRLRTSITDKDNLFYKNIIRNELSNFMLQFLNIKSKELGKLPEKQRIGHKEEIAKQFIQLLIENYKQEHEVSFYSNELCITPEYLSKIMKGITGKTVNKWISDALMAEAKILLRRPDSTVQEVAEELNFSDQSYFGKFFKKHTGKNPLEYKKAIQKT